LPADQQGIADEALHDTAYQRAQCGRQGDRLGPDINDCREHETFPEKRDQSFRDSFIVQRSIAFGKRGPDWQAGSNGQRRPV
jgi:hypothetical protein